MGDDDTDMKKEINNLIWMYGDGLLTLRDAEVLACDILVMIKEGKSAAQIVEIREAS